ncbi:hypothetical protein BC830DRAFT_61506 [Chytriomyces sp. MP71]|nr:hypothetical protein BC830DRAFT_61506 [Chytriomyces sp. MP71]
MKTHVVSCQGRMHGAASGVQKMSKMAISFVVDTSNATKNASSTASLFVPHSLNAAEWFSRPLLQQLGGKEARELEGWRAQCLDVGGIVTMANKVGEPSVSPTSSTVSTSSLSSTDRPFVCLLCGKAFAKGRVSVFSFCGRHAAIFSLMSPFPLF